MTSPGSLLEIRNLVEIRDLTMGFPSGKRWLGQVPVIPVLREIDLDIVEGETLGLVGESGSGKSTLGRCLMGLYTPFRAASATDPRPAPWTSPARKIAPCSRFGARCG